MALTIQSTNWGSSLLSMLGTSMDGVTSAASGTASSASFGPAGIYSSGQASTGATFDTGYSQLAAIASQMQSSAATSSQTLTKEEKKEIELGTALRLGKRFDEAQAVFDNLLKKKATNGIAIHGLGAIALDQGDYKKAEQLFLKADFFAPEYGFSSDAENAKILQGSDEAVYQRAEQLTRNRDTMDNGVRLLVSLTNRSPGYSRGRMLLAESLIRRGDATNALSQYQTAITTASETQLQEIETRLDKLVEIAPQAAYLRNLLGQTQLRLGKADEALETLALASELSGGEQYYVEDEARAHVAVGHAALERGEIIEALGAFQAAAELAPTLDEVKSGQAEGYLARGEWLARMGDPNGAIEDCQRAKRAIGSFTDDEFAGKLAAAAYAAGRRLEAKHLNSGEDVGKEVFAFQMAYDLDPDNAGYRTRLAEVRYRVGEEYLADEDYKNAAYAFERAYTLDDDNEEYKSSAVSAFVAYADERLDAWDFDEAIEMYAKAYEIDPDNEDTKQKLADAYNARGLNWIALDDEEAALEDFEAALDLYPDNEDYQANLDSVS